MLKHTTLGLAGESAPEVRRHSGENTEWEDLIALPCAPYNTQHILSPGAACLSGFVWLQPAPASGEERMGVGFIRFMMVHQCGTAAAGPSSASQSMVRNTPTP
ncbi:zinc finger protein basonuclin-1-like [Arapaima gigas]